MAAEGTGPTDEQVLAQQVLGSMDHLMQVVDDLIGDLRATKTHYRRVRSLVQQGATTREALGAVPTGQLRQSLTKSLDDVERARHHLRRATIAMGRAEGLSLGELGRMWGFSRQLAARYAREADSAG